MKRKALIICTLLALTCGAYAQENDQQGLARVKKRQGIEIYVMCEPLRPYEVVGECLVNDSGAILQALGGQNDSRPLDQKVDALIMNAKKRARKGEKKGKVDSADFDAILTDDGNRGVIIRFTDTDDEG